MERRQCDKKECFGNMTEEIPCASTTKAQQKGSKCIDSCVTAESVKHRTANPSLNHVVLEKGNYHQNTNSSSDTRESTMSQLKEQMMPIRSSLNLNSLEQVDENNGPDRDLQNTGWEEQTHVSSEISAAFCKDSGYNTNTDTNILPEPDVPLSYQCKQTDHFVDEGELSNLMSLAESGRCGGTLKGDIEQRNFEGDKQYHVVRKIEDNFICRTKSGFEFRERKVTRISIYSNCESVKQLSNYVGPGKHAQFVPLLYGLIIDDSFVHLLLSHRKGLSLKDVVARNVWSPMEKLMFVTYLLEGVQSLHNHRFALLGINPASIELSDDHKVSSIMFSNVQFSERTEILDEQYPMYCPPENVKIPSLISCMWYDMWGVGSVLFWMFEGRHLWAEELLKIKQILQSDSVISKALRRKIRFEGRNVHMKVMKIDQRKYPWSPSLVHLILCLLNPVGDRRAKSVNIHQHILFYFPTSKENSQGLRKSLQLVSTRGHGCDHCVVTVTDTTDVIYVTLVPKSQTLHAVLTDKEFLKQVPVSREEGFYQGSEETNHAVIREDTVFQIDWK